MERLDMKTLVNLVLLLVIVALGTGCRSPYYADRGALFGGLSGAGIGAAIGNASGNTGAGAVIGSALGTITGAAIGDSIDADLARSRAEIEAKMGRQLSGATTPEDVIAMTRAGLSEEVIVTHIRASGVSRPLGVNDLIYLRDQGVSDAVVRTMQQTPQPQIAASAYAVPVPRREVVVEHVYQPYCPPPYWYHQHHHHHRPRHHGGVSWGISVAH
jgi:hypothetical protein